MPERLSSALARLCLALVAGFGLVLSLLVALRRINLSAAEAPFLLTARVFHLGFETQAVTVFITVSGMGSIFASVVWVKLRKHKDSELRKKP